MRYVNNSFQGYRCNSRYILISKKKRISNKFHRNLVKIFYWIQILLHTFNIRKKCICSKKISNKPIICYLTIHCSSNCTVPVFQNIKRCFNGILTNKCFLFKAFCDYSEISRIFYRLILILFQYYVILAGKISFHRTQSLLKISEFVLIQEFFSRPDVNAGMM